MATQREAYYCLVQYFKNQAEFNSTLQGKGLNECNNYVCMCTQIHIARGEIRAYTLALHQGSYKPKQINSN